MTPPSLALLNRQHGTRAVIFAGGRGARLAPLTTVLPKPLLPIQDRSMLQIVIEQLVDQGLREISLSVGYLAHLIEAVVGDGSSHGAEITYVYEREALGTAGPLRLMPHLDRTFLAMNADVLTDLPARDLLTAHMESGNTMTIATYPRRARIEYGVLGLDGANGATRRVTGFEEKPEIPTAVSMGVYALEPKVLSLIPEGVPFDMPDLVKALLDAGERVGAYVFDGTWLDIGRPEEYARAQTLFPQSRRLSALSA